MQTASQKIVTQVKDRRILQGPTDVFGDYWRTYAGTVAFAFIYYHYFRQKDLDTFALFSGILTIALSAARDSKRGLQRKLDAIIRRMEEKDLL
jgi:hypothetical protein